MSISYPFRDGDLPTGPAMFFSPAPANPPTLVSLAGTEGAVSTVTKQRIYSLVGGLVCYQLSSRQTPKVNRLLLASLGGVAGSMLALRLSDRPPQEALGRVTSPPLIRIKRGSVSDARLVAAQGFKLSGKAGGDLASIATNSRSPWAKERTVPGVLRAARAALKGTPGDQYVAQIALKYAIEHEGWRPGGSSASPAPSSAAAVAADVAPNFKRNLIRATLGFGWLVLLGLTVRAIRKRSA